MKRCLIVVDMQNDFIDGALGTGEAVAIVGNVKEKIAEYRKNGDTVICGHLELGYYDDEIWGEGSKV